MSASLRSRLARLERRSGPCPFCAGRPPQLVIENDPSGGGDAPPATPCPACGGPPPQVVLSYVDDFFSRPAEPGGGCEGG
jgi:hypothetical protein